MPALRLSTGPAQGMVTSWSARARYSGSRPEPSLPMRRAELRVRSRLGRSTVVGDGVGWASGADGGDDLDAAGSEDEQVFGCCGEDGEAEDGADAGAEGLAVPGADGVGCGEEAGGAEGLGGADEGAEVAGVLEADGDDDEGDAPEELVEGGDGREEEGGDALGRAGVGEAGEDVVGEAEDFDGGGDVGGEVAMFGEEDGFEEHAAAEGFLEQVIALDGDEAAGEAGLAGEGAAELLDAGVGAAGDGRLGDRHSSRVYAERGSGLGLDTGSAVVTAWRCGDGIGASDRGCTVLGCG